MLEITVNVTGLEGLVEALKGLAGPHVLQDIKIGSAAQPVLTDTGTPPTVFVPMDQPMPPTYQASQQMAPPVTVPVDQPLQQPVQQPMQQPVQQPAGIPTSDVNYTFDQLAVAATQVNDMGKRDALVAMLNRFGVPSMTQLPKEMYGAFANELRVLGAKL